MRIDVRFLRRAGLGLSSLLLAQIVLWTLIAAAEIAGRPTSKSHRPFVEYVQLDEAGAPEASGMRYRANYDPSPSYKARIEGNARNVEFQIPFAAGPASENLALYLGARRSIKEIRLNDTIVQPNVPLDSFSRGAGWEPVFYMLPAELLRPGENRIEVRVASQGYAHVFPEFQIGPAEEVARAYGNGKLFNVDLPLVAIGILCFTALLCSAVNWPSSERPRVRALIMVLLLWALGSYAVTFSPPFATSLIGTIVSYYTLAFALPFAAAYYVLHDVGAAPSVRKALVGLWGGAQTVVVLLGAYVSWINPGGSAWLGMLPMALLLTTASIAVAGTAWLARAVAAGEGDRWMERTVLMVCLAALVLDAADSELQLHVPFMPGVPLTFYATPLAGLFLGLGMVLSLAREAAAARRAVLTVNDVLAERLATREAELAQGHYREKQMLARQTLLEERQRIVRDMHDGIGGELSALLLRLRQRSIDEGGVELAVDASLNDLRLMVDALDVAESNLSDALLSLERRLREQLRGSDIALHVEDALDETQRVFGPRHTLHILRILQEAVTNARRHARPSRIGLRFALGEQKLVQLSVSDNGCGIPATVRSGRGLSNMRTRAQSIAGDLHVASSPSGTTVTLTVPDPASPGWEQVPEVHATAGHV